MVSPQYAEYLSPPLAAPQQWAKISLFAAEYSPENGTVWHFSIRRRTAAIIAIALLLHLVLLYFVLTRTNWIEKQKVSGENKVAMLYFPTLPQNTPTPPRKETLPKPSPPSQAKAKSAAAPTRTEALPPPPIVAQTITPPPQEEEDMLARIEAARKRRALANQEAVAEEAEDENQRGLRIAKANFAASQRRPGSGKEDSGGVFQIRNLSYHSAEFTFRGWNATMRRMWPQNYEVQQGQEPDIEQAIIKKMIEVIRKYKDGDFQWESHRMGRTITLSARLADTAQLQQFLLREFFPDYKQTIASH